MLGRRPVLGQVVVPFVTGYLLRFTRAAYGRICIFLREGVDSDPEVNSRRFSPCSHAEDEVAALVVNNVSGMFFWLVLLDFCTSRCVHDVAGMTACTR